MGKENRFLAPPIIGGKDGDFNSNRSLCFNWTINFDVTLELDNAVPFWITDDRAFESIGNAGIIILVVPKCPVKQKRIGGDRHIRKVEKEKTIAADRDRAGLTMDVPGPLFIGGQDDPTIKTHHENLPDAQGLTQTVQPVANAKNLSRCLSEATRAILGTSKAHSGRGTHFYPPLHLCPVTAIYTGLGKTPSPPVSSFPCPAPSHY